MIIGEVNACVQAINTVANAVKNGKKDKDIVYKFQITRDKSSGYIVLQIINLGDKVIKDLDVILEDGYKLINSNMLKAGETKEFNIVKLMYTYHKVIVADTNLYGKEEQKVIIVADGARYESDESLEEIFNRLKKY